MVNEQKKKYLSIQERINKLKQQGLVINSKESFQNIINSIGYYKLINGYRDVFMDKKKHFYKSTKLEEIVSLYEFDNNLKNITLKIICDLEVNIKSLISELFSKKYGIDDSDYFSIKNFNIKNESDFNDFKKKFFKQKEKFIKDFNNKNTISNEALVNYYNKHKIFPLYIIFKISTFGSLSIFYSNMKSDDQIEIAKNYNIFSIYLKNYLNNIHLFRNICAHNERLFCFKTQNAIRMKFYTDFYKKIGIPFDMTNNQYRYGLKDFFSLLIMLKLLTPNNKYNKFIKQIKKELKILKKNISHRAYGNIMHRLGFVKKWYKVVNLKH